MFKFLRVKRDRSTAKRARLPKECFGLKETLTHGFPYHPTCLAYDSKLGLLALGTQQGSLRVYGKPGVELIANEDPDCEIVNIVFIEGRGQIVVHCHDNSLSLWEINVQKSENGSERSFLERVKTCHHFRKEKQEGRSYDNSERSNLKQITSLCVDSTCEILLVGMQGGNISIISLETFDLKPEIIYQDVVIQNMPDSLKKTNPGAVETIVGKPHDPDRVLIGYTRGLLVLWNKKTSTAEHFYNAEQQLESVCWLINGEEFISSHNDGSYIQWKIDDQSPSKERQIKEYGPFPCKPIHKIVAQTTNQKEEYLIFEGGLSRSDHRDKNAVTILKKGPDTESKKHHTLDLSARVIDFIVIPASKNEDEKYDSPEALIVLTEEEIVAIDLLSPEWLQYPLPYLSCIHSSPITYAHFYSDTPADVYEKIEAAGIKQSDGKYSTREWPIQGGNPLPIGFTETKDLLITGHEDGSVRFWAAGGVNLKHLYTLETSRLFNDDIPDIDAEILPNEDLKDTEDQWPFFRKVGSYDPFADDLRLQIQRFVFSALSSTLVVAGSAGQVIIFTLTDDENFSASVRVENLNLISGNETFTWKGEPKLKLRPEKAKFVNFEPLALIQTNPPSNITSLAWHSEWKLLAIGNAYGFGLYDFVQHSVVVAKCTLNPRDSEALAEGDALISRRKSFKKSLRESIRRLRRVRSTRDTKKSGSSSPTPTSTPTKGVGGDRGRHTRSPTKDLDSETKPVERRIEARQTDEISGPVVRYLYIGLCGIDKKDTTQTPTLWAGTHAGMVYALAFNIPGVTSPQTSAPPSPLPPSPSSTEGAAESGDKSVDVANDDANDHQTTEQPRKSEKITFLHGREMRLAHKAPVIFIQLLDSTGYPQPDPLEVKHGRTRAALQADKVLVCTEEQFILYTLPQLKHHSKFKLTAAEGLKARKIAFSQFAFDTEEVPPEQCLVVLSNSGEVEVFSSELEQRLKCSCISNEDRHGISHLIFTAQAEGLYLHSPSEYKRFSLSTKRLVEAISLVRLPDGARPQKAVEVPPVTSEENVPKDIQNGDKADDKQVLKETVEAHDMPVSSPTSETNFCADETDRMNDTFKSIGSSQDMNESERDDIKDLDISKINLNGSADVTLDSSMFTHPPSPNQTNDGDLEKNGVLTPITGELIEGDNKAVSGGQKKIDKEENEVVNRSVHIASH